VVLVEFAIVLPILMLLILGILCFGSLEDYSNQATQIAEEGARWAAVDNNPSSVTNQSLQTYLAAQLQAGDLKVTSAQAYLYCPSGCTVNNSVTACVVATVQYPFVGFAGANSTIVQAASMRIEQAQTAFPTDPNGWNADTQPSSCPTS
jgi:Flp pilus assembly protein TadG